MIRRRIEIAQWTCDVYISIDGYWIEAITRSFLDCGASDSVIRRIQENMERDDMDSGFTYSNPDIRRSVMVIGKTSSGPQFLNSFIHELRHLVDDIAKADGMEMSGEGVAYLSGDTAMTMADIVCRLSCDHCRTHS